MILNNRKYGVRLGYVVSAVVLGLMACGMCWLDGPHMPVTEDPRDFFASEVNIRVSRNNLFRLRLKREEAMRKEILFSSDADWVRGWMRMDTGEIPIQMRLKGDWTDHLQDEKWSFRVKCSQGTAWKGMRTFSLQSPHTRSFLHEWALHRFLSEQDLLTPRYDFVKLRMNGAYMGTYALEEHFSKELLESQGRRAGLLLKMDESGLWAVRDREFREEQALAEAYPVYESANLLPFQLAQTLQNDTLRSQWKTANLLLHQYHQRLLPFGEIFDLEAMGKRQAVLDVFGAHHALYWSNARFYFNPITQQLEPVIFDGFAEPDPAPVIKGPFLGYGMNAATTFGDPAEELGTLLFAEPEFVAAYYGALHTFHPDFMARWIDSLGADLTARQQFLASEYFLYDAQLNRLRDHAEAIHSSFAQIDPVKGVQFQWVAGDTLEVMNLHPVCLQLSWIDAADSTLKTRYLEATSTPEAARRYRLPCRTHQLRVGIAGSAETVELWNREVPVLNPPLP